MVRRQRVVTRGNGVEHLHPAPSRQGLRRDVCTVRDALGLTKGTQLKVELEGNRIVLRKSVDDAVSRARGRFRLDGFESTDQAMRAIRAPAEPGGEGT